MVKQLGAFLLAITAVLALACTADYETRFEELESRVSALEQLCSQMNTNISSLQSIASAAQTGNYITGVAPITYNGKEIGYTITFAKGDPITIYHGNDGKDGSNGNDGTNGNTPKIGVKEDTDGIVYWTVDDAWLLDAAGKKVKAVGADGKDGADGNDGTNGTDGTNGQDGVTPQLKIEADYWYVSTDNGKTWTKLSKAKGEDGKNGKDGDSMFTQIDTTSEDYVIFTLSNGTTIKVPTWAAFDRLNTLCSQMNSNLEGISSILEALDGAKYIKSVSTITENGKEIGYMLTLSDNTTIKLYHGKDGAEGQGGGNGQTPAIGVKQDTDNIWYWTLDGDWLLDDQGNKVKASGTDGEDGAQGPQGPQGPQGGPGAAGKDGVTPQLKIENDYWYVSLDKGENWTKLGKATGEDGSDGDSFFKSVTEDNNYVYLTLDDDTVFKLSKSTVLDIMFDSAERISLAAGIQTTISYEVTSSLIPVTVSIITSSDIKAKANPASTDGLTGTIAVTAQSILDGYSQIIVLIDNGEKVLTRVFTIDNEGLQMLTSGIINNHEWVDLGLPSGLKWATCNVGAETPEDYGNYFAWGETEAKSNYDWSTYKWCNGTYDSLTKYNTNNACGTVDNKILLEVTDDAARANWGGSWRMPTDSEWKELIDNCTWTRVTQNGGRLFSGPNGNSIFLPAAGWRYDTSLDDAGSEGLYRSSSLYEGAPSSACYMLFYSNYVYRGATFSCYGMSVRPVTDEGVRVSVSSISLDHNAITLVEGTSAFLVATVLPANATQPAVIWSSSNPDVATVDYSGKVTAVAAGTAIITATTYDGGKTATCKFTVYSGIINDKYYVDLGLPSGLKWAVCNVGANQPEEYGDYFAWGDTEPNYVSQDPLTWKTGKEAGYTWTTYKFRTSGDGGDNVMFSKYNTSSINYGPIDDKTTLELADDAARANWGSSWRMPTDADWSELIDNCTWIWTSQNGVNGGRVTSNTNGNSIFLPAAGYRDDASLYSTGSYGYYWSSSLLTGNPKRAWYVGFYSNGFYRNFGYRYCGFSVRPVSE